MNQTCVVQFEVIKLTLGDFLFGIVKLTKNANPDKYGYSGYVIDFDARSNF